MRFTVRSKLGLILSLTTILTVVSAFMVMAIANRGMGAHAAASQSLPTGGLTFASTPTSAAILSSSVVTAAGKGTSRPRQRWRERRQFRFRTGSVDPGYVFELHRATGLSDDLLVLRPWLQPARHGAGGVPEFCAPGRQHLVGGS